MKIYGVIDERTAKKVVTFGTNNSLKDIVDVEFKIVGAVLETGKKKAEDGTEYETNYIMVEVDDDRQIFKFTQTIIGSQLEAIFENDLADDKYKVKYANSNEGNRYLTIVPCF